ncbi:MAG: tRNA pseudouridine(55) synthase TruB [Spirochaetales bacterium]
MRPYDGGVLLDKPEGVSSFKALGPVKRALGGSKVGHTGTLDPFASGLMVALCGRLTKLAPQCSKLDKTYEAVVFFGEETETLDPEGPVVARGSVPSYERIVGETQKFVGTISQRPPAYSAVHVGGRRAYELARTGAAVELPERNVTIRTFDILAWSPPELTCRITVSAGTYIRSIARDLGRSCGSVAYLSALRRIAVGPWHVSDSVRPDEFSPERDVRSPERTVATIPGLESAVVAEHAVDRVCSGVPLRREWLFRHDGRPYGGQPDGADLALFDPRGDLLAVATPRGNTFAYRFVRPRE